MAGAWDAGLAQDTAGGSELVTPEEQGLPYTPARWWKELEGGRVECGLCPRKCRVADRERGTCGVRENRDGGYYTLVHSRVCAVHLDPIEKKPFYHVLPGRAALSIAAPGCNIECKFCQNWQIAQVRPEQVKTVELTPASVAGLARRHGAPTIACTYTEPVVWSEYVQDTARAGKRHGLRTLLVSNGYIEPGPLGELLEVLGAVKIDLKAFTERFYRDSCRGELAPVLDTLRLLRKKNVWTEIVVLIVPTLNDSDEELRELARFVKNDLGPEVPVHFTRFHPSYRLKNLPPTPVRTLERARDISRAEGLSFVYVGNVPGHAGNHTYCPRCERLLIRRIGYKVLGAADLAGGRCPHCEAPIPGIWT
jgi:pyruvate formate lyase activating enzyme